MKKPSKAFMENDLVKSPFNPSKKATARVKDPLPVPTHCPSCDGKVACVSNELVYGRELGDYPWIYICTPCDMYVGIHPFTNIPVGTLANRKTREARTQCKKPFLKLVALINRKKAYEALAGAMGIPVSKCHFGWFDITECLKARHYSELLLKKI